MGNDGLFESVQGLNTIKNCEQWSGKMAQLVLSALQAWVPKLNARNNVKTSDGVISACNPSVREVEAGGSLKLTAESVYCTSAFQNQ